MLTAALAGQAPAQAPQQPAEAPAKPPAGSTEARPQQAPKVEVTGPRNSNETRRASTASKIIISREDIEQYGDNSLGEVLRRLPGVTQGGRPGRGGPVQMRGMGGGFTQILINGERMAPGFSIEQITPEQVERIEILRAPTAESGARAIAGTINVILREPLRARHNDIRAGITAERGYLTEDASWSRNDTFSEAGTYNATLSATHRDQLTDTSTLSRYTSLASGATDLQHEGFSSSRGRGNHAFLSSRFQWRLGAGESLSIQPFLVQHRNSNLANGTLRQDGGSIVAPYAASLSDARNDFSVARAMSMLNKRIDQDTRYELRLSGGRFASDSTSAGSQFNTQGLRTLLQTVVADSTNRSWNSAGKITRNWGNATHALVAGGELESARLTDTRITTLNGNRILGEFGDTLGVSTKRSAFYIQDEWDPQPAFGSYFGLRWEQITTESRDAGAPVKNTSRVLTPLAHGVWRFAAPARDQIRLSLTQSYRAPTTQQLVSRPAINTLFPPPGANTSVSADNAGNPRLKPERANGLDLAYENYLKAGGIVSVNLFARRIRDLIRNVTSQETVTWAPLPRYVSRPQNLSRALTTGLEFDAKFQLPELIEGAPAINVRSNLSLYRSRVNDVIGPNNRIDQQPRATGNIGGDYKFRGTPLMVGGNLSWTPAYETQQTNTQALATSTKRVVDVFALWTIDASTKLRLSASNLAPRDLTTTSTLIADGQQQRVISNGRTDTSIALRLEMRL